MKTIGRWKETGNPDARHCRPLEQIDMEERLREEPSAYPSGLASGPRTRRESSGLDWTTANPSLSMG
jgi:hypothetical protein